MLSWQHFARAGTCRHKDRGSTTPGVTTSRLTPQGDPYHPVTPAGTQLIPQHPQAPCRSHESRDSPTSGSKSAAEGPCHRSAGRVFQPVHTTKCSSAEQARHARNTGTTNGALHHSADTRSGVSSPPLRPDLGRGGRFHANTEGAPGSSLGWPSGHQQTRAQVAPCRLLCNIYHGITYPGRYPIPSRTVNKYIHREEGRETGTNQLTLRKGLLKHFFFCANVFLLSSLLLSVACPEKQGPAPAQTPPLLQLSPVPITLGSIPAWGTRAAREGS